MYHLVKENVHKYAATVSRRDQLLGDGFHLVEDEPSKAPSVPEGEENISKEQPEESAAPEGEEKKPEPVRRRK